jgi:hypothetical protein
VLKDLNDFRWPPKYLRSAERHENRGWESWIQEQVCKDSQSCASRSAHSRSARRLRRRFRNFPSLTTWSQTGCLKFLDVVRESRRADVVQLKQSIAGAGPLPRSNLFQYIDTPRLGQRSPNPLKLPFRHHSLLSLACHCSTLRAPNGLSPSKLATGRSDIQVLDITASVIIQTRFGSMIRRFADSGESG